MNLNKKCFRTYCLAAVALLSSALMHQASFAQGNIRIVHQIDKESRGEGNSLGRDVWFCIPSNAAEGNQGLKYFNIYVTSPRNTTVNFQRQGYPVIQKPVTASKVTIFTTPTPSIPIADFTVSTEITSSGDVETNKAIHIWSDNADIAVYFLSRVPFSSDGAYILPTTGWGKEYVVGSYSSLLVGGGGDEPSEFAIVANQNNTLVNIIPTQDIRATGQADVVLHPKGVLFSERLNRGECVQYKVTRAQDESWDVSGTIITANNPVGVMGAATCPFIQPSEGYCDYILEMMQPVRAWSNSYFTAPFAGRKYGGDGFLIVGSKNGQVVTPNPGISVTVNRYQPSYFYDIDVNTPLAFTSSDPFMLMQYVCSATHSVPQGAQRNQGDPASVVINPADQFTKKVIFQIPTIIPGSGQTAFTNYVNILVPTAHLINTYYDGNVLATTPPALPAPAPPGTSMQKFTISTTGWTAVRLTYTTPGNGQGTHTVISDTGVGVYTYGYGSDDSYAWAGNLGTKTPNSPDTIPPAVNPFGPCFCATVGISDTGLLRSGLSSFIVDSSDNILYYPDTSFSPGSGIDTSFYEICIIDSLKPAYISVSIYDVAGNRTTVFSSYKPEIIEFKPSPLNFGTVPVSQTGFRYDTICNTGISPFNFDPKNLNLSNGTKLDNLGFSIDSAGGIAALAPGDCRVIKIKYVSTLPPTQKDTMSLNDECLRASVTLIANGGQPDFDIGPYSFDCTALNFNRRSAGYFITNPSGIDIQIDSVWIDAGTPFNYPKPPNKKFPITVPNSNTASGQYEIFVDFDPQTPGTFKVVIHVKSGNSVKTDTITGIGCAPDNVALSGRGVTDCDNAFSFKVPITNTGTLYDSIISVQGTSKDPAFSKILLLDAAGNTITLPFHFDTGATATIYAAGTYTPKMGTSGCFIDTIDIKRFGGSEALSAVLTDTVCVLYREITPGPDINFGTLPFGSAKVQNSFQVCNTGTDPVTITKVDSLAPFDASLKLTDVYKVGGIVKTMPITIAAGECVDVFVEFDPAYSNAPDHQQAFKISSNSCVDTTNILSIAQIGTNIPNLQGFTDPAIFSCSTGVDSIRVTNPNDVDGKVTLVTIAGIDAANFKYNGTYPIIIPKQTIGKGIGIPITFTPNAQAATRTYSATVNVTYDNGAGNTSPLNVQTLTAIGQGMDLTVTSQFSQPEINASAGTIVTLPVQLALDKHNLATPLDVVTINRIQITYNYDTRILHVGSNTADIGNAVTFPNGSAWELDPGKASTIDESTNTLQINLHRKSGALSDADITKPIAIIGFKAVLPDSGAFTKVKTTAVAFIDSLGNPMPSCVSDTTRDSTFNLIYLCGDSTLQRWMNGIFPLRAYPITPNPSSGKGLSFKYALGAEGSVTLELYDELGRLAARVIDNRTLPAGTYEVRYNGSTLSAGNYIYRYTLDNKTATSGRFVIEK